MSIVTNAGWSRAGRGRIRPFGHRPPRREPFGLHLRQANLDSNSSPLLYLGMALGVLAGAVVFTYLWRRRLHALNLLQTSPLEQAEQIISSCEDKLESLEQAINDLKSARPDSS